MAESMLEAVRKHQLPAGVNRAGWDGALHTGSVGELTANYMREARAARLGRSWEDELRGWHGRWTGSGALRLFRGARQVGSVYEDPHGAFASHTDYGMSVRLHRTLRDAVAHIIGDPAQADAVIAGAS